MKCVFVHGWGMNHAIWAPLLEQLPETLEPMVIDLPGHGQKSEQSFTSLAELVDELSGAVAEPAIWVAWSLGGLAVLQLALQQPEKVSGIVLLACNPCFVQRDDWPCAMPASVFDDFAQQLEMDFSGTIRRFLSLQVKGSESGRQLLRQLRQGVLEQPPANIQALRSGLELLKTVDLRAELKTLAMPVHWYLGGQDGLVKSSLKQQLAILQPQARVTVFPKAAHAPFLSHLDQFIQELATFVEEIYDTPCER
ncbi:MAG: pimeloyl-ACP methyl ester esterase BioH [Gammaproteobacteria bacterium]|nr:pimeloyl-ACP methyl ester esterase BioH [Gammaproteobacteria bacterium]